MTITPQKIRDRLCRTLFDQPIMGNQWRSIYVEFMVALALEPDWEYTGSNWQGWDFSHRQTGKKLELKQSALRHPWSTEKEKQIKSLRFEIEESKGYWNEQGLWQNCQGRLADIYVFAIHELYNPKEDVDQRDPNQWKFRIIPEHILPKQKTIGYNVLKKLPGTTCDIFQLSQKLKEYL